MKGNWGNFKKEAGKSGREFNWELLFDFQSLRAGHNCEDDFEFLFWWKFKFFENKIRIENPFRSSEVFMDGVNWKPLENFSILSDNAPVNVFRPFPHQLNENLVNPCIGAFEGKMKRYLYAVFKNPNLIEVFFVNDSQSQFSFLFPCDPPPYFIEYFIDENGQINAELERQTHFSAPFWVPFHVPGPQRPGLFLLI